VGGGWVVLGGWVDSSKVSSPIASTMTDRRFVEGYSKGKLVSIRLRHTGNEGSSS